MMIATRIIVITVVALLALWPSLCAQAQQPESKAASGSIAGRLTLNGRGLPSLEVLVRGPGTELSVTSDEEGRYRFAGLAPGRYSVAPLNSAYIIRNDSESNSPARVITLKEGEALEGVDFALVRGGVITGKLTSAEGRPIIARRVDLILLDEQRRKRHLPALNELMFQTDDRGIYRFYGLPAGRYLVSAGDDAQDRYITRSSGGIFYPRIYYPGVSDEAQAAIIEVREGSETANIDLQFDRPNKLLSASGRIVTETGQPVPNIGYDQQHLGKDRKTPRGTTGGTSTATNAQGEFRLQGLMPGYYMAYAVPDYAQNIYSEPIFFEITDRDLTNLQITVQRGGTIKGVVALDGNPNPALLSELIGFTVTPLRSATDAAISNQAYIEADSSFVITKLRPGKVRLVVNQRASTGLTLARVERNGVEQPEGIEVGPGEDVTGVRLVFAYGENIVRGQVKIEGGQLPEGAWLSVSVSRPGVPGPIPGFATGNMVDGRGQFTIKGLAAGDYELLLWLLSGMPPQSSSVLVTQKVTVTNGAATQVTLTLNPTAKDKEEKR